MPVCMIEALLAFASCKTYPVALHRPDTGYKFTTPSDILFRYQSLLDLVC